ncbi:MAG: hypothetical protein QNJ44_24275 [Rhodobacter sp.]|nr:hypothetical protein [Rhodobacter sp.]
MAFLYRTKTQVADAHEVSPAVITRHGALIAEFKVPKPTGATRNKAAEA